MPHPALQGLDIADVILQISRRERVSEFVQEEIRAVRSLRAFVAMFRNAPPAIHFRVERDAFQFELVALVWPAGFIREHQGLGIQLFRALVLLKR